VSIGLALFVVLGALTAAAVVLKTYIERDARFRIAGTSQIQATGLSEVSRPELLPVFGEDIGRNVFFVPIGERRRELESIPWIEHATVMRVLPDQIRVDVVERKPVAFTRHGQQIGLVDANGVLLDMPAAAMAAHHYSFPVITGLDSSDTPAARQTRMAVYMRLMGELDANNQHYSEQISEIDLTDPEDARVQMPEQGTDILAHFGEDHFLERYQRYEEHIAAWRAQYPKLAAVDLRYEKQVVLQMTPDVSAAQTSANAAQPADAAKAPADALAQAAKTAPAAKTAQAAVPTPAAKTAAAAIPSKTDAGKSAAKTTQAAATARPVTTAKAIAVSTTKSNGKPAGKATPAKIVKTKLTAKQAAAAKAKKAAAKKKAVGKHQQQKKSAQAKRNTQAQSNAQARTVAQTATRKKPAATTHVQQGEGQ
jgi:cell division protein FtsQ